MLTTLALNEAELKTNACTEFVHPNAKLLINTPDSTINVRGGNRTAHSLLLTHSLLTITSEEKPKSMLAIKSKALVNSNETWVEAATCFKAYVSIKG